MDNEENGQHTNTQTEKLSEPWRYRLIAYIERKLHERKAKKKEESPTDKAARRTATATVWIAVFTIVLALVGTITLIEVIVGGSDTQTIAEANKTLAEQAILATNLQVQQARAQHERPDLFIKGLGVRHKGDTRLFTYDSLVLSNKEAKGDSGFRDVNNLQVLAKIELRNSPPCPGIDCIIKGPLVVMNPQTLKPREVSNADIKKFGPSNKGTIEKDLYVWGEFRFTDWTKAPDSYQFCRRQAVEVITGFEVYGGGPAPQQPPWIDCETGKQQPN